jgi:hypothetical protein
MMDLRSEDVGGVKTEKKMGNQEENSKVKGTGSVSSKGMMFRADQIDLKSLDMQLEKHLSRVWSKNIDIQRPKEEWEIDLSKLDIRYNIADGTYGSVYRGTYDSQDVAGNTSLYFPFSSFVFCFCFVPREHVDKNRMFGTFSLFGFL